MGEGRRNLTSFCLTIASLTGLVTLAFCNRYDSGKIHASTSNVQNSQGQNPDEERKKKVLAEGYQLRDKLYTLVDKNRNRVISDDEGRNLLDLVGFEKTFLHHSNHVSIRPKKEGDEKLNFYLTEGLEEYVGTITYSQAEAAINKKK